MIAMCVCDVFAMFSLGGNSIGSAGVRALAPHLGGLTALQTLR